MIKSVLAAFMLFSSAGAYAAEFSLQKIDAAGLKAAEAPVPQVPPAVRADAGVPQDLVYRFQQVYNSLSAIERDLTWVRSDIDRLDGRARQIVQLNSHDAFFQSDLRRMSSDMSRRFTDMQRAAYDLRALLSQAQKSADLNRQARDIETMARDILRETWPGIEDAAQRLEWTVRSGKPELLGYDAQWTASDVSRYARQFSDQARTASYDAQDLVNRTQP